MITALVGGQYGSEGKGLIAGFIGEHYRYHVRVGAANAGHTLYTFDGEWEKHVVQQIPCGAYARPVDVKLYIGPGALISPGILLAELDTLVRWRRARGLEPQEVYVDMRAHVIHQDHIKREARTDLAERIGSTSTIAREGIGIAQADRVMRSEACILARDFEWNDPRVRLVNVPFALATRDKKAKDYHVLLEGTQGYSLSNVLGDFPYVTSRNTTSAALAADAGVPPNHVDKVIVVVRTFPIRVAGPSGDFYPGSEEIEWEQIGVDPDSERTTVTKKVRRVATFSYEQVWEACKVNGATDIALTFADYVDPMIAFETGLQDRVWLQAYPQVERMVDQLEYDTGVSVTMLGTGPTSVVRLDKKRRHRS
jgi:adenylosuccinate synthase